MIKKTTPKKKKKAMTRKKIVADEKLIDHVVFPIKTVIAVVIWVGGLISMYFALRVDIKGNTELATDAKILANETKERVEKYDLSVVIFKVNSMENNIKEIKTSVDGIQKDINRIATSK